VLRDALHFFFDTIYHLLQCNNLKSRFNILFYIPMTVVLDWDESFSMQSYVTTPGSQSVVFRGYISERRPDGVYVAPLLPQLFYGADGTQLSTWRQYISGTGQQTILSRSGGQPSIPKEELYWKKVRGPEQAAFVGTVPTPTISLMQVVILGIVAFLAYKAIAGRR